MELNIGDYVLTKTGEVKKITSHDMPDLAYEEIVRLANKDDFMAKDIPLEMLEHRMYFLVPYNISPIQQGIQAGHASLKFLYDYARFDSNHIAWDFILNHETWIILNGGTTNNKIDINGEYLGTLNKIDNDLFKYNLNNKNKIQYSTFYEPDLNNALSAISLIVDERVFNRKDFPDFKDWEVKELKYSKYNKMTDIEKINLYLDNTCLDYKTYFLKELLNNKKLA